MEAKVSIVLLFVLSLVTGGSAISCHSCSYFDLSDGVTGGEEGCKTLDNVDYSDVCIDGTATVKYCAKITASNFEVEGLEVKEYLIRSCGDDELCPGVGSYVLEQDGVQYKVQCCEGDNCNSGAAPLPAPAISCHQCLYAELSNGLTGGEEGCKTLDNVDYSDVCIDGMGTVKYCAKITASNFEVEGQKVKEYFSRSCGDDEVCPGLGSYEKEEDGVKFKVQCCEGDSCNSGTALLPAPAMLLVTLLGARITL